MEGTQPPIIQVCPKEMCIKWKKAIRHSIKFNSLLSLYTTNILKQKITQLVLNESQEI